MRTMIGLITIDTFITIDWIRNFALNVKTHIKMHIQHSSVARKMNVSIYFIIHEN